MADQSADLALEDARATVVGPVRMATLYDVRARLLDCELLVEIDNTLRPTPLLRVLLSDAYEGAHWERVLVPGLLVAAED